MSKDLPGSRNKFKKVAPSLRWRERPKIVDQKQLEGQEAFPTADIRWNRPTVIFFALLIGIPYVGALIAAFYSGVKAFIIAMIACPLLLGGFAGLLHYFTRNLR